jgi:hypothetical protein
MQTFTGEKSRLRIWAASVIFKKNVPKFTIAQSGQPRLVKLGVGSEVVIALKRKWVRIRGSTL